MTDSTLRALFAMDEIARDPAERRVRSNRTYGYEARSSVQPASPRATIGRAL